MPRFQGSMVFFEVAQKFITTTSLFGRDVVVMPALRQMPLFQKRAGLAGHWPDGQSYSAANWRFLTLNTAKPKAR